jgi:hypothetical protein
MAGGAGEDEVVAGLERVEPVPPCGQLSAYEVEQRQVTAAGCGR